jgi:sulfonate transport system substrate-binding protein
LTPTTKPAARRSSHLLGVAAGAVAIALVAAACGSNPSSSSSGSSGTSGSGTSTTTAASGGSSSTTTANSTTSTAGSGSSVNVSNVTLNIGDQAGTGAEALLTAAGLINKLPFKVKWDDFTSGPPILQAMNSGSVDVGGVGDAPPVFSAAGGAKIAVIDALKADPYGAAVLVPKNSTITSVSQLKGKKIAVAQGSSGNYHILALLEKNGLSVKDVDLDYLQPADGLAAFTSGSVQAWDIWAPFVEEAVSKYGARILANGTTIGQTYSWVVASRSALDNPAKNAAIKDYIKTLNQAYSWAATHPSQWAVTWAKSVGYPLPVMDTAAKDSENTPTPITSSVVTAEQGLVSAFYKAGLIPKTFSFSDYVYTGYNSLFSSSS